MPPKESISIILPVFNEEPNLEHLMVKIISVVSELDCPWEIIAVNDCSQDRSGNKLDELAEKYSNIFVIHFARNFGQTAALSAGFQKAKGEIIITMDSDFQNDPEDIPLLLEKIHEGYDVVSGWRKQRKEHLLSRRLTSWLANKIISMMSGLKLNDYGCTLKAYKRHCLKGIKLYGEMHRYIPLFAYWHGASIAEIPVKHHPRQFGKSNYGLTRIFKVLFDLFLIKFLFHYSVKPIHIFGAFGLLNFLGALLTGFLAFYFKFWENKALIETPLLILAVMFTLIGCLSFLMGLLAEMITRIYYETQDKPTFIIKEKK